MKKKPERKGTDQVSNRQLGYVHASANVCKKTFEKQNQWLFNRKKKNKKGTQKKEMNLRKRRCWPQDSQPNLSRKWKFIS
jgi:hypothetical protein